MAYTYSNPNVAQRLAGGKPKIGIQLKHRLNKCLQHASKLMIRVINKFAHLCRCRHVVPVGLREGKLAGQDHFKQLFLVIGHAKRTNTPKLCDLSEDVMWATTHLTNGGKPHSIMYMMTPAAHMSIFDPYLHKNEIDLKPFRHQSSQPTSYPCSVRISGAT